MGCKTTGICDSQENVATKRQNIQFIAQTWWKLVHFRVRYETGFAEWIILLGLHYALWSMIWRREVWKYEKWFDC
jgi:hypothetical protein